MIVTCRNMLKIPGLEKMKLVAGKDGLDKVINWVHIIEIPNAALYLRSGELLFMTGVVIGSDSKQLLKFIKDISSRKLSGLVINIGPYIKSTPKEVLEFADRIEFPVFELPFEVRLIDVTQIICKTIFSQKIEIESMNNFIKDVIIGDIDITQQVLNRAILYGYSINMYYCVMVIDIDDFSSYIMSNKLNDEYSIMNVKNHIYSIIDNLIGRSNRRYFIAMQSDSFSLMLPVKKDKNIDSACIKEYVSATAQLLKDEIQKKINSITVSIGIGGICSDLSEFKQAISEGKKVLQILKRLKRFNCIVDYKELGIFRLFFEMSNYDEMKKLFNENLLKLKEYDDKNSSYLVKTLNSYLTNNRNLGKTSEELYIHRNTMKYRVKRIEEILNCDLKDGKTIFNIKLSIRIGIFLDLIKL